MKVMHTSEANMKNYWFIASADWTFLLSQIITGAVSEKLG